MKVASSSGEPVVSRSVASIAAARFSIDSSSSAPISTTVLDKLLEFVSHKMENAIIRKLDTSRIHDPL